MKAKLRGSILAVGVAVMACAGVWADVPATQPTASVSTTRPSPLNLGQWRRAWALTAGRTAGIRPYTQEEWNDMMAFMRANSPARWRVLSSLQLRANAPIRLDDPAVAEFHFHQGPFSGCCRPAREAGSSGG
jgi:hypothetical protein